MALVKDTNSYVDLAEADAYFLDRLDVAAWDAALDAQKEQALITATTHLESLDWVGQVISDAQNLAFPRYGVYYDPRIGSDILLDATVPDRILKANYEMAYHFLNNDGILDDTGKVESIAVGSITLTNIQNPNMIPLVAKNLIKPLLVHGGNSWWRAN